MAKKKAKSRRHRKKGRAAPPAVFACRWQKPNLGAVIVGTALPHILTPEDTDSIQTAVLAIKHGLNATDLGETIFPYLTTVEGLKPTAQAFDMDVAKLSCCAG